MTKDKQVEREGIVAGYMQAGRMIECGNCHPKKYEDCKNITEKYPHIICNCVCHDMTKEGIEKLKKEAREKFRNKFAHCFIEYDDDLELVKEFLEEYIALSYQQGRQEAVEEVLACKPEEKKPPKELEPFIELDEEITNAYLMAGRYVGTRDALKEWEHKIEALKPKE